VPKDEARRAAFRVLTSTDSQRGVVLLVLVVGLLLAATSITVAKAPAMSPIAASDHTCILTAEHDVACWGDNSAGGLGDGTTTSSSTPVSVLDLRGDVMAVAAGDRFSCALSTAGGVKCWGNNAFGQLGDGTTANRTRPVDVVGLANGTTAIAARGEHACALAAGTVKCWGANINGQLGDGSTTNRTTPVDVAGLTGISSIVSGGEHTCALSSAGNVTCWGWNNKGQLGDGTTTDRAIPTSVAGLSGRVSAISAGGRHTCALMASGGVECWGFGEFGQLGDGTSTDSSAPVDVIGLTSDVATITLGGNLSCGLTTDAGVTCWGLDLVGDDRFTATPAEISALSGSTEVVTAGFYHVCAIKLDGVVTCWGGNDTGQLGNGTTVDSSVPTDVRDANGRPLVVGGGASSDLILAPIVVLAGIVAMVVLAAAWFMTARRRAR
jgi:alpha-tubulin suppressor-like RCC1 family protein